MAARDLLEAIGGLEGGTSGIVRRSWVCASCRQPAAEERKFCESCAEVEFLERRRARLAAAWASLPARFRGVDSWRWPEPRRSSLREIYRDPGNCLLVGTPGVGKTAGACAVFAKVLRAAESKNATPEQVDDAARSRFVSVSALIRACAAHPLGGAEVPMFREAARAPLLVLDELGYDLGAPRHHDRDLVDARYNSGGRTIFTTGHTQSTVEAAWGGGTGRRVWTESTLYEWAAMPTLEDS